MSNSYRAKEGDNKMKEWQRGEGNLNEALLQRESGLGPAHQLLCSAPH